MNARWSIAKLGNMINLKSEVVRPSASLKEMAKVKILNRDRAKLPISRKCAVSNLIMLVNS